MFFVAVNGIVDMVLIPPFSGGNAVVVLECSGKVHLVGIPHCQPNIPDRKTGQLQQLRRFEHAVIQQEFLWRFPQCFLENFAEISAVQSADTGNIFNRDPFRERKLLLHKREILKLLTLSQADGYSLIPLRLYLKDGKVKLELAVAKGKKLYDKRHDIAERDAKRAMDRRNADAY